MHHFASNIVLNFCNGACNLLGSLANLYISTCRALQPPGYYKEWHVGVRVASNKKLVAFIAGVPTTLQARGQ
jgi:hypothetical protein